MPGTVADDEYCQYVQPGHADGIDGDLLRLAIHSGSEANAPLLPVHVFHHAAVV